MKQLRKPLVHDAFGDAEAGENEKKHEDCQDPASVSINEVNQFEHE